MIKHTATYDADSESDEHPQFGNVERIKNQITSEKDKIDNITPNSKPDFNGISDVVLNLVTTTIEGLLDSFTIGNLQNAYSFITDPFKIGY